MAVRAFDPNARLLATNAESIAALTAQFGDVGKVNGPRVGPVRRTTRSNEAYLARRLVLHLVRKGHLDFPISVEHSDAPDFVIWHGGKRLLLEVTEACPSEEGRASAIEVGVREIGDYSNTGTQKAVEDLRRQIQGAITRKASKLYAGEENAAVLVYPNSDASMWVALFRRRRPLPFLADLDIAPFKSLHVAWSRDRFYSMERR
jgi:hypothetical protein